MYINRRQFLGGVAALAAAGKLGAGASSDNWYEKAFYLLHLDHHTSERAAVGRDADPAETARLLALSRPDVIQIHAKGNPGWTTYPSQIGFTPPKLQRDVLRVWTDIARRDGYRFSAYYNLGRDGEIMKRRPEWNRAKADGTPFERALCYHSGVAEQYLWPMIDEIGRKYRPDGFWFDGSCFTVSVCYCARCRERFQREQGMKAPERPAAPGWAEYKEMQRAIYRDFVRQTVARVKRTNPSCLVAVNWAYSLIMPEAADGSLDYLSGDRAADPDVLSMDAHWYDAQGKPFDLMTSVFSRDNEGALEPKPVEQIEQEMAIITANGGRYFAWDNPTPSSGLVAERQEYAGRAVAPWLRQRQPWCQRTIRLPDVSVLNSATDHYAATLAAPVVFNHAKRLLGATDAICRQHLNYEVVSSERLKRGDVRSAVLIVDDPQALAPDETEALRRFVSGGGILVLTGNRMAAEFGAAEEPFARRRPGKGEIIRAGSPLAALAPDDATALWKAVMPADKRLLHAQGPATVEIVLRRRDREFIVHLVNRAEGKRQVFEKTKPGGAKIRVTDIPSVPGCHVSLQVPAKPSSVVVQPAGQTLRGWSWRAGRLEIDTPAFRIHQMLVVTV